LTLPNLPFNWEIKKAASTSMRLFTAMLSKQRTTTGEAMTFSSARKISVLLAAAALSIGLTAPVFAQSGGGGGPSNDNTAEVEKPASAPKAKTTKADRKAARKQARAKKNAELKKLEDAGYKPSANDPNYPTNLQNAQKKAGIGQGASQ
jgi:Domain of unknown function (DUF4148)